MSLLMKALEKAAQDRNRTTDQSADASVPGGPRATGGKTALSLEPALKPTAPDAPKNAAAPAAAGTAIRTPPRNDQARAAVLLGARQSARSGNIGAWISTHPVPFAAALAGFIALGYAIYLYLQIMHPALFLRTPAVQAQPVAAEVPKPVPAPISAPSSTASTATDTPAATPALPSALIPAQSVFSSRPGTSTHSVPETSLAPLAPGTSRSATRQLTTSAPLPAAAPVTPAPAVASAPRIVVSRGDSATPRINAAVSDAYAALETGRLDSARQLYEQALRGEPNNIDALLGLAAIARHENRSDDAAKYYVKILESDPRHALAQAGLIALLGRADPQAAESRLKQLASREPSPALYFTLGNLYADQGQWSQAQQAYFQAHHLESGNPDYAYNLAVSLEHISQPKLALGFYRRAVQLAAGRGRANFNTAQAEARIAHLATRVE